MKNDQIQKLYQRNGFLKREKSNPKIHEAIQIEIRVLAILELDCYD